MSAVASFQPLFPEPRCLGPLLEQAAELLAEGHRLEAAAGSLRAALVPRLRAMNSYYTNKIEGQHTRPADIERALANRLSADQGVARKQRLAIAHIEAEAALEASLPEGTRRYEPEYVRRIHAAVYQRLPDEDRRSPDGVTIVPGNWRDIHVTAGRHLAPAAPELPALLGAWNHAYSRLPGQEHAVVGALCAHHRLLWIHPFTDGNGRTARLHTHLVLTGLGVTQGLWSPLRGLARQHESYYEHLANADLPRRNDLDGRGALSQEALVAFASFGLDVCLDQARFMRELLGLGALRDRIAGLLGALAARPWRIGSEQSVVKLEAVEAVHYVALCGPLERARFMAMTGLAPRMARRVLKSLLDFGLFTSEGPRSPVSFAVPLASLRHLFPRLWPEAEVE